MPNNIITVYSPNKQIMMYLKIWIPVSIHNSWGKIYKFELIYG